MHGKSSKQRKAALKRTQGMKEYEERAEQVRIAAVHKVLARRVNTKQIDGSLDARKILSGTRATQPVVIDAPKPRRHR